MSRTKRKSAAFAFAGIAGACLAVASNELGWSSRSTLYVGMALAAFLGSVVVAWANWPPH